MFLRSYHWWQRLLIRLLPGTRLGLVVFLAALALLWFGPQMRSAQQQQARNVRQPQFQELEVAYERSTELYDQGRFRSALPFAEKALALSEQKLGLNHPNTATSMNNLAVIYIELGRYDDAEALMLRALVTRTKAVGWDHPNIATGLSNLAGLYAEQGRYKQAEPYYREALALLLRTRGPGHVEVMATAKGYALTLREQGRNREAASVEARAGGMRAK